MTFILQLLILSAFATSSSAPLIIAHRGASGYRPEHTLEAYQLAIEQGADYIEPDLVATKDGVLVARHENEISETTDVATKFPDRKKTKTIDGETLTGWFTEDFTLAELKTLRAKERLPMRSKAHDGKFSIATFDEIISLVKKANRPVGLCPELKHPGYFKSIGLDLVAKIAKTLSEANLNTPTSHVMVQSFEVAPLKELKKHLRVQLVFLIANPKDRPPGAKTTERTYGEWLKPDALREIKTFADILGPAKQLLLSETGSSGILENAKAAGLKVVPYTFREEKVFWAAPSVSAGDEYRRFMRLGIDGLFTDFPDKAIAARKEFLENKK